MIILVGILLSLILGVIAMSKSIINIQKEVNPHFKSVWTSKDPFNVLEGGRNSFKSSVISLLIVFMLVKFITKGEKANVVVIRKVANTIRDSVFLKLQWALRKFHILDQFNVTVTPFRITHIKTGSTIYFYGQDDFQRLKSNDIGDLIAVWVEEAAEFNNAEEFDQMLATFMRQKHILAPFVRFFWSFNPPRNPYSWINEWVESLEGKKNWLIHKSNYLNDELGFVTEQMLDEINRIKENDYDYYRYIYLGEPVGMGTNIYNIELLKRIKAVPTDEVVMGLYFGIDTGHQVSATVCICAGLTNKGNVIILNTYYYSPDGKAVKKAPSDLAKDLYEFIRQEALKHNKPIMNRTIDSAEGGIRNQYYKDYGQELHPVNKSVGKVNMIDHVQDLMAQGRLFIIDRKENEIVIDEHKKYQWDQKTLNRDEPRVIKENDHSPDALQYLVMDNLQDFKLKY